MDDKPDDETGWGDETPIDMFPKELIEQCMIPFEEYQRITQELVTQCIDGIITIEELVQKLSAPVFIGSI